MIAVNDWDEDAATVGKFATQSKLTHKILLMGGKISPELYGVTSSPTSFWIDHKGIVRGRSVGFNVAHVPKMEQKIEKMLAEMKGK